MVWWERGIQVLLTTMGAFAAFALMTVAIGTDYWLYARAFICNSTANSSQEDSNNNKDKKDPGALTHSGLWRICCLEGTALSRCGVRSVRVLLSGTRVVEATGVVREHFADMLGLVNHVLFCSNCFLSRLNYSEQ